MDEAVAVFRKGSSILPYPIPSEGDLGWDEWHAAEKACRERCEIAIQEWMISKRFPILDDDEAYFLRRRFDMVSLFLQKLFLDDQTSIFSHVGFSLDDVLWWALVDWWEIHGIQQAFFEDLEMHERAYNERMKD